MKDHYSTILVTGGAGFIGSHIVDRLLDKGFKVRVIDNLSTGEMKNLSQHQGNQNFQFVKGDIRNFDSVKKVVRGVDAVFHEAALVSVVDSVKDPLLANEINVTGTVNLLKASADAHVKRLMLASSAAIYGDSPNPLKKEEMTANPSSPYGVTKLTGEYYAKVFNNVYDLETVSLRYFNVYGPRQSFDIQSAYGGVITIFTNRLLENKPPIIYGDGEQTRDFVYIEDVVQANMLALKSENAAGEVFNIGSDLSVSVNYVADTLKEITNKEDLENIYQEPRPADPRHGRADITKAQKILGYKTKFSLKKGLNKLVKWYVNVHQT